VLTGKYAFEDRWLPSKLAPGHPLPQPQALFKRLDEVPDPGEAVASS
jgi:hypothetical protein